MTAGLQAMAGRPLVVVAVLALSLSVQAGETAIETFDLEYRTAEEVVPLLRPLVPRPGVVTGMRDQVIVRGSPEAIQAVAEVLERLDRAPRRLMISVRQERSGSLDALGASLEARVRTGEVTASAGGPPEAEGGLTAGVSSEGAGARARVLGTRTRDEAALLQQVQTLEGRAALIRTGESVPVGERYVVVGPAGAGVADTVRYLDVTSGFWVLPRVSGDRVTLEVSPHSARLAERGAGVVDVQSAETVVSGRLGDWIVVASTAHTDSGASTGIAHSTRRRGELGRLILVRVEELP
jgi:type II secretory pathway component GspD/PulD (secretin)